MTSIQEKPLYSGKTKSLYETEDAQVLRTVFRDDATAFNAGKHEIFSDKGYVNNQINAAVMNLLENNKIPTALLEVTDETTSLMRRLDMLPLESVVRNVAAGSLCKRLGIEQKKVLDKPLLEFFLKDDALGDPMVNDSHALAFGWATQEQLNKMRELTLAINAVLKAYLAKAGLILVDAKFEFGIAHDGIMYLGDEITPDSCRIWDETTGESLDKDRFRLESGELMEGYRILAQRLEIPLREAR